MLGYAEFQFGTMGSADVVGLVSTTPKSLRSHVPASRYISSSGRVATCTYALDRSLLRHVTR